MCKLDEKYPHVSRESLQAFDDFLSLVDIRRFRKNLRTVLFQYLLLEYEELIPDFEHFIEDMRFVFEFFDKLEEKN